MEEIRSQDVIMVMTKFPGKWEAELVKILAALERGSRRWFGGEGYNLLCLI